MTVWVKLRNTQHEQMSSTFPKNGTLFKTLRASNFMESSPKYAVDWRTTRPTSQLL